MCPGAIHELDRALVADRAVGTMFVVVPTPSLAFRSGVVEGHEPGGVQAFSPDLSVEGLRKGVVRRLAGAAEVQGDAPLIGPEIEVAGDKFGTITRQEGARRRACEARRY